MPQQGMYQGMQPQMGMQMQQGYQQQAQAVQGQPLQNTPDIVNSAQALRTAMKGAGTDERAIIYVAKTHNWQQREAIAQSFCS